MTNNFERLLGEGGFGKVFYGIINNTEVAVKMLSPTSVQGYQQFQAEACNLLTLISIDFLQPNALFLPILYYTLHLITG